MVFTKLTFLRFTYIVLITLGFSLLISLIVQDSRPLLKTFLTILTGIGLISIIAGLVMIIPGSLTNPIKVPETETRKKDRTTGLKVIAFGFVILLITMLIQSIAS